MSTATQESTPATDLAPRPPLSIVVDRDGDIWAEQPRAGVFQCLTQGERDHSLGSLEQEYGPVHRYVTPAAALAAVGATLEALFGASESTGASS